MKRRSSLETFQTCFPSVNLQTKVGMAMFQGFVGGFNKALELNKASRDSHKKQIEKLQEQITELEDYISCFRFIAIHPNDAIGEEA